MRRRLLLSSRLLFPPSANVGSSLLPLLSGTCHWLHFSRGYTVQSVHLQRPRERHCQVSVSYNVHPYGIRAPMRVRTRFFQNTGYRERCQPICVRTHWWCVMSCIPPRQSILAFHASTSTKGGGESTNAVHHEDKVKEGGWVGGSCPRSIANHACLPALAEVRSQCQCRPPFLPRPLHDARARRVEENTAHPGFQTRHVHHHASHQEMTSTQHTYCILGNEKCSFEWEVFVCHGGLSRWPATSHFDAQCIQTFSAEAKLSSNQRSKVAAARASETIRYWWRWMGQL